MAGQDQIAMKRHYEFDHVLYVVRELTIAMERLERYVLAGRLVVGLLDGILRLFASWGSWYNL